MSLIRIAAITVLAGLIAAPAFAQNAGTGAADSRARAAFERLDTNKDGFIDRAEMRASRLALFERLDTNKDGQLTPDEMRGGRTGRSQGANSQRTISRDDFVARGDQSMMRRDTDKDGRLSFAEFSARRGGRAAPAPTR